MKKNTISVISLILSIIAIIISILTLYKVSTSSYNTSQKSDSGKHSFDTSLVGDWSGTDNPSTVVRMKILDDSTIIIEDPQYKNSNYTYLYVGHIEGTLVVIEKRGKIDFDNSAVKMHDGHEYVVGELIDEYLSLPEAIGFEEYYYASNLTKLSDNIISVGYGVGSSQGDVFVSFVKQ